MAVEQNNSNETPGGDRGVQGRPPTISEQISAFRGASVEDGVVKSVQDGETSLDDPDDAADSAEAVTPPPVGDKPSSPVAPATTPKPKSAQERINEAVKKQRSAERALETERAGSRAILDRLERLERGGAPAPLTNNAQGARVALVDASAPDPAKYQYGDLDPRYIADLARNEATKLIEADRKQRDDARRVEAETQARASFAAARDKVLTAGTALYPDFRETVLDGAASGVWDLSQSVCDLAFESDVGPQVLYHLATNIDESKALAKQSPVKQAAWFGKMEAFLASSVSAQSSAATRAQGDLRFAPTPARMTQAPPIPERRVRGGGNPNPASPDTTDFAAFERLAAGGR